ncbi:MAG: L-threonylcarbamoyladenylate synthase [Cyclobacteriaceae bacterium]
MAEIGFDISKAISFLQNGDIIGLPTETVYGLAANATNATAVAKVFEVKNRPSFDPLIVHSNSLEKLNPFISDIPEAALQLARNFWPGPLTLVLPKSDSIPDLVTSGLNTVAIRVPDHKSALELLERIDFPIAAPSANPFGYVSPTSAQHVQDQLGAKISYILDGGLCKVGLESTIVGFHGNIPTIYRLGGISQEEIEATIGTVEVKVNQASNPRAPGMLQSHYSPQIPLIIGDFDELTMKYHSKKIGLLSLSRELNHPAVTHQIQLSHKGDLVEAASNLFSALRKFKATDVELIIAERMPDKGLGRAINDRLERASFKN